MTSIFINLIKSFRFDERVLNLFKKFYPKSKVKYSYEDPEVVSLIVKKTSAFFNNRAEDVPFSKNELRMIAIGTLANLKSRSVVVDFGGGAGHHYKTFKKCFPNMNINWIVVETKEMVKQSKNLENKELVFVSSFKQAIKLHNKIDLVYSDSALQYCSNPIEVLKMFILAKPDNIFINRTMMSEKCYSSFEQISFISKNGPGELPETITDFMLKVRVYCETRTRYLQTLKNNYSVIYNETESTVTNPQNNQPINTFSIYSKRTDIYTKSKHRKLAT